MEGAENNEVLRNLKDEINKKENELLRINLEMKNNCKEMDQFEKSVKQNKSKVEKLTLKNVQSQKRKDELEVELIENTEKELGAKKEELREVENILKQLKEGKNI